jgi:diguanylate cyclase (GGDEF)-like protein
VKRRVTQPTVPLSAKLPKLLSVEEVAALIHRHPEVVRRQARDGRLPAEKIGRVWFFRPERLVEAGYAQFFAGPQPVEAGRPSSPASPMLAALSEAGLQAIQQPERQAIFEAVGTRLAQAGVSTYVFECTIDGTAVEIVHRRPLGSTQELAQLTGNGSAGRVIPFARVPHIEEVCRTLRPKYIDDPDELVARVAMAASPGTAANARRIGEVLQMQAAIMAPLVVAERAIGVIAVMGRALRESDVPAVMAFANQTAAALETAHLLAHSREMEEAAVMTLAGAIELREALQSRAREHGELAVRFAGHLGFDAAQCRRVRYAALLQDLGKLSLPDVILKKRGRLDAEDRALLMTHPVVAADLLGRFKPLAELAPLVRSHHEWFNGDGYPDGLRGDAIPLETRVITIVNAFFNTTFELPRKTEMTLSEGLDELRNAAGVNLDPALTEAFVQMMREAAEQRIAWFQELRAALLGAEPSKDHAARNDILSVADSRELRIIYRIAQETTAVLDLTTLLERIVKIIRDVMGYYLVSILLPVEKKAELRVGAYSGYDRDITGLTIPVDGGITGWVFTHGAPLIVADVRSDPRYIGLDNRVRSELAFPLISHGRVVGVLNAESDQVDAFSETDLALMSAVGSQLASNLEVAQLHDTVKREASHDPLTRLFNRRLFVQRLEQEIGQAEASGGCFSIVFLDVDQLKRINDTYGHLAGDALIREVANALMDAVRGEDLVARYGGDEFIVLLPTTGAGAAATVAQRIAEGIARHRFMAARELLEIPGVSLGVATYPDDGRTAEQLLAVADATLYRQKRKAS